MKRAPAILGILGVIGLTALIAYLAITRHLALERAARLDRALMNAERRALQLESDLEAAKSRLAELSAASQPRASAGAAPSTRAGLATPVPGPELPGTISSTSPPTSVPVPASRSAADLVRYAAAIGPNVTNLVRIEGTSSVHDWQVEGQLVGGTAEFEPGFPRPPAEASSGSTTRGAVSVFIPVRSLRSVEKNGARYSDAMDEIMYGKLRAEAFRRITYTLRSLTFKEQARGPGAAFVYEATGNLCVAGETNSVTMPLSVSATPDGLLQFAGSLHVKMTDFKITPPSPSLGGLSITTGDEVTLRFRWSVKPVSGLEAGK